MRGCAAIQLKTLMGLANPSTEDRGRRKKGEEIEVKSSEDEICEIKRGRKTLYS